VPNLVVLGQFNGLYEHLRISTGKMCPPRRPFNVTQGHWNRLIGYLYYLFIPITDP